MSTSPRQNNRGNWLRLLGPGIITAAIVFGPSKITITSKMGASYGYQLIWLVVVAIAFMLLFTEMATRIAYARDESPLQLMRHKWGATLPLIVGSGIFLVTTSFQAGNAIGVGIAIGGLTNTPSWIWITLFTAVAISMLFFRGFYRILEKWMIGLVILMLVSFLVTLFISHPSPAGIAKGLLPTTPAGSLGLIIAFMASCFSIVAAFYQAYLVQERRRNQQSDAARSVRESRPGILLLGLLVLVVMIAAAAVLHRLGQPVLTAMDMARALEPLFGKSAYWLFLLGLFGASFSSLIGNATVGGSLMNDAWNRSSRLDDSRARILIAVVMIVGAVIAISFGKIPLQAIVLAQSVTIFIVPIIGTALFLLANDRDIMGSLRNNRFQQIMGIAGLLLLATLAVINAFQLFT